MKRHTALSGGLIFAAGMMSVATAQQPIKATQGVVLEDVTIVNTATGSLTPHRSVVIEDGKIKAITGARVQVSGSAKLIKASGKYVVPGYADMHAHVVDTADKTPSFFPLLIANGVTFVREESPSPANMELAKKVNADAAAGQLLAPEIIFQGGEEHLPPPMSATDASNNGSMPSMDHLGAGWGLVLDCSTDEQAIRKGLLTEGYKVPLPPPMIFIANPRAYDAEKNAPFYQRIIDTYSDDRCETLSKVFAKNHTWQTVTLIRLRTQDWGNAPEYRDSPNLKYMSKEMRGIWDSLGDRFATLPPSAVTTLQAYYGLQKHVTGIMNQNGVKILAGSDAPGVWLVPGFSLHQEFQQLADSGLSPLQVLQATTLNAAEFLHREASMGSVDEGKIADLVLLDGNPIVSSANLDKIAGVVVNGHYLARPELDKLESDVAQAYK